MTGKTSPVRRKRRPQRSNTLKDIGRLLGVADNAHTDREGSLPERHRAIWDSSWDAVSQHAGLHQ